MNSCGDYGEDLRPCARAPHMPSGRRGVRRFVGHCAGRCCRSARECDEGSRICLFGDPSAPIPPEHLGVTWRLSELLRVLGRSSYSGSVTWRSADRMATCLLAGECPRALGRHNLPPTDAFSHRAVELWGSDVGSALHLQMLIGVLLKPGRSGLLVDPEVSSRTLCGAHGSD